jgi:probable HAF family extracellular repeat protein
LALDVAFTSEEGISKGGKMQYASTSWCRNTMPVEEFSSPINLKQEKQIMNRIAFAFTLALLACASLMAQESSLTYTFQDVTYPNDKFVQLLGINKTNVIAGYHGANTNHGFTLTLPGTFTPENYPKSAQTQVIGINSKNTTVGFYVDMAGTVHGFLDGSGKFTNVDFPGTTFNQLLGENDQGQAAGYYQDAAGNFHPYIWAQTGGVFEELFIPVAVSAQATSINNKGVIVGFYIDSNGVTHGWQLSAGIFKTLDYPASTFTQALGINTLGEVVGSYNDAAGNMHGFAYVNGTWSSIDDPNGVGITLVNGVNDNGVIVGFYTVSDTVNTGFVGKPQ